MIKVISGGKKIANVIINGEGGDLLLFAAGVVSPGP